MQRPKYSHAALEKLLQELLFYVVRVIPIARQRVAKHIPAEAYRGTIGRPFLDNGAVNTLTNGWETVFSVLSVQSGYKRVEFRIW
jgi:hypothetical protein